MITNSKIVRCYLFVLVVFLTGCAQNGLYHSIGWKPGNCVGQVGSTDCKESYYQEHESYDLAFAEFSERGNAFNDAYVEEVLERIKSHAEAEGVVLVTFIHGWKHNANENDPNLINFKSSLQTVSDSGTLRGRRLVGLYIGWRGASITLPWLEETTFWDRKAVAEEVGKGGVTRLLLELDKIDSDNGEKNVLVVIGHSFGGAIVVSALSEVLTERVVNRSKSRNYGATLGDAVIVLNPAIEANQALNFVEAVITEDFPSDQHPLFVSISTDGDFATHNLFPLGQTIGLLLTWKQSDLHRNYYYDRLQKNQTPVLKEEHLDATTVGNFAPFLSHRLSYSDESGQDSFLFQRCDIVPDQCVPKGRTTLTGQPTIRDLPENYPLYFIKTDESIMEDHNDIFSSRIHAFMLTVVDDVIRRNLAVKRFARDKRSSSILANPAKLQSTSAEFLKLLMSR